MDEQDRAWLEANATLRSIQLSTLWTGGGSDRRPVAPGLDYSTMLHPGRVRYLELSDAADNREVYCAVAKYDHQTEAVVIVVTDSVPVARVQLRIM
jgi:hypothetical protein